MKNKLVVIGNGMAGVRSVEELLKVAPNQYDITVIGDEPHPNYNRIMLSPLLSGEKNFDEIIINSLDWYADNNITLLTGSAATKINRVHRNVELSNGRKVDYDRLLIATGSNPFILPIPGNDLQGVIGFRTVEDVETMVESSKNHKRAVVIGGGLLGLEAANGLQQRGMTVTIVHRSGVVMDNQLDGEAANLLRKKLEDDGLNFLLKAETEALLGTDKVSAVRFKSGLEIPADLVVMAVGIRPSIQLAKSSGITVTEVS